MKQTTTLPSLVFDLRDKSPAEIDEIAAALLFARRLLATHGRKLHIRTKHNRPAKRSQSDDK